MQTDSFTELVPRPARGRVFTRPVRPGFADCAPSGRVRLDAIARWLQDVAYEDVEEAGVADLAVWVVRRTRILVRRFPRFGERLTASTFCSGMGRMWAERRTTITRPGDEPPADKEADVDAVSLWVHLDPRSWRPAPFAAKETAVYGESAGGRRVTARLRQPGPSSSSDIQSSIWHFRGTELDIAGHINNAAYWSPLEEGALDEPARIDVEVEFRTPSQAGAKRVVWERDRCWILAEDGETHASAILKREGSPG